MAFNGNNPNYINPFSNMPPPPPPPVFSYIHTNNVTRGGRTKQTARMRLNGGPNIQIPVPSGEVIRHDFDASEDEEDSDDDDDSENETEIENKEEKEKEGDGEDKDKDKGGDPEKPKEKKKKGPKRPPVPPGTRLEVKRVDEVFDRTRSEWDTRDSIASKKSKKDKDKYAEFAFTVNRKFNPTADPTLHIISTTLDIKSSYLRNVGKEVVGQVQGISWTSKPLKVDPQIIIAFLPQLQAHADALEAKESKSEDDVLTLSHLLHLLSFIRAEHTATLEELAALLAHGEITFDLMWALLVPRTVLYAPCPVTGEPRAVRVTHAEICSRGQGGTYWRLDVEAVEYNAQHGLGAGAVGGGRSWQPMFGLAPLQNLEIPNFKGATKITGLPAYPIKWYPGVEELTARLIERGKKWATLQGVHHMYYSGTGFHFKDGKYVKLNTNSRIMVDWQTFAQTLPNYEFPVVTKALTGDDIDKHPRGFKAISSADEKSEEPHQLANDDYTLASPIVYGFSLADKLWLEFNVDHVRTFEWNDEPFSNLVLARDQKMLIQSLVEAHSADTSGFDDFVEGKGRGLIINLFGNPGVGKSLTAEATSEHVRKPLYVVGAGDLGTSAAMLDVNLTRIFNISSNWGAVVLIDEADVFLEERSFHDLERNAMVAVFLRQLEYFRGILFLTTNRVRTFDEAFQSRIHVALRYQDLTADAKRQIWVAFLKKARAGKNKGKGEGSPTKPDDPDAGLRADELHELGEKKVNGRQIKNVVRTASALASSRKEEIGYKHLVQVLDMMDQFDARNAMYQ